MQKCNGNMPDERKMWHIYRKKKNEEKADLALNLFTLFLQKVFRWLPFQNKWKETQCFIDGTIFIIV